MPPQPARPITSRQNPIVTRFKRAAREADPEVLIEGATLIEEAARAGWAIRLAAFTRAAVDRWPELWRDLAGRTERVEVSEAVLSALSPARAPSGAVALATPMARTLDDLAPDVSLAVAAVSVQDPGNLGAIVRSAEALGAAAVITCDASADPFGWKALRGAMGSAFRLPIARRVAVDAAMTWARERSIQIVGLTLDGTAPASVDLRKPTLVLVGAEGSGLPRAVAAAVDRSVTLQMQPPVESLNVAVATALLLYEARRQREGA